jgi:hypothetical protein
LGRAEPAPAEAPGDHPHVTPPRLGLDAPQRVGEQRVLGPLEPGVLGQQDLGAPAGALEQRRVVGQPREAEAREARLARAGQLALAAQLEVDLGEREAVGVLRERLAGAGTPWARTAGTATCRRRARRGRAAGAAG